MALSCIQHWIIVRVFFFPFFFQELQETLNASPSEEVKGLRVKESERRLTPTVEPLYRPPLGDEIAGSGVELY